ncbi:hypothetical protein Vretimale_9142 [Volvox reticuliferus]|uniref:Uncharacterized protein n=1 Tax=Volvox reticuliferus TaxID=1737510 RepID=A0A8J4GC55_9CHLO|nr:hypothetical protein Vretifemale_9800 [Volvox reticuliferus]GIM04589.1 hypothetical protein Vretimale_9142 [Volvox reticuliferus]
MATAARWNGLAALVLALLTFGALIAPLCQAAAGAAVDDDEAAESLTAELRKARPPRQRTRAVKTRPPPPHLTSPGAIDAKLPPAQGEVILEGFLSAVLHVADGPSYVIRVDSSRDIIPLLLDTDTALNYVGTRVRVRLGAQTFDDIVKSGSPIPVHDIVRIDGDDDTDTNNDIGVDEVLTGGAKPVVVGEVEVLAADASAKVRSPSPRRALPSSTPPRTSRKPPVLKNNRMMI